MSVCCVGYAQLVPEVYSVAYGCAIASGTAHPVTDAKEKLHALRLLAGRYAKDHPERFPLEIKENFSHTAVWKIRIQEISGKRAVYPKTGWRMAPNQAEGCKADLLWYPFYRATP